ncbi:Fur family transcriptional regulator [Desulfoferrobacter suflitae]|uniref:Fur family transcriptional regulator n=1 Tax=Desulfoferrobacter suflitae TaxID=2865782 RepID=UPI002164B604|nr:transcriptional repressor [Desulfoferrobacter suflitae]MCK8601163.1 transcriptional repressor [Desulfoferrobacter suflitae]
MNTRPSTTQQRIDQMVAKLKAHDCRITPQRLAILRILAAGEDHPSVEMVHERVKHEFPTTSIATVYKTVHLLKQINEVVEIAFPDWSNRYDGGKPFPHPHVICIRCRKITDPKLGFLKNMTAQVAAETGFDIVEYRLDFFGICADCKEKEGPTKEELT